MPKRLTYNEIKSYIEQKSNGTCELITSVYKNNRTKLELICACGNRFTRTFAKIKNANSIRCNNCTKKEFSERYRDNIDCVKKYIESKNCKYISGVYNNTSSILTIQCACGNVFNKDMNHFKRGQTKCPQCSNKSLREHKKKYNINYVEKILKQRGFTLTSVEYLSCDKPLNMICPNGHNITTTLTNFTHNKVGCKQCVIENSKGEKHWNYKGGESDVLDTFRKYIKEWKSNVLYSYNYRCALTNTKNNLVVHHVESFSDIVKKSCEELDLQLKHKIKEYSNNDFEKLKNLILSKHTLKIGIVLERKIHNKFHRLYGKGNNTKEQFMLFVSTYYPEKYNDVYKLLY